MAQYLILTLLPEKPVPSVDFRVALSGAKLHLYDRKANNTGVSQNLLATIDFPTDPGDGTLSTSSPYYVGSFDDSYLTLKVPLSASNQGFPDDESIDLYIELESSSGEILTEQVVSYNFVLYDDTLPITHPNYDDNSDLVPNGTGEFKNFNSNDKKSRGYVFVPVREGGVSALFREDGKAPDYDKLCEFVEQVLLGDNILSADLDGVMRSLNFEQCLHIARELSWTRFPNKPQKPQRKLKNSYEFNVQADGTINESLNDAEKRTKFENELRDFYGNPENQARKLANYIFALSCAKKAEYDSSIAQEVLFRFPVNPALTNSTTHEVNVHDIPAGTMTIGGHYWYAVTAGMPIELGCDARFKQTIIEERQVLVDAIESAIDDKIIDNSYQSGVDNAVVKMRMLDTSRGHLITVNSGTTGFADIEDLIIHFVANSSMYWSGMPAAYAPGHYELVTFALAQGISQLQDDLRLQYPNLAAYLAEPADDWLSWYLAAYPAPDDDAHITFIPNGKLEKRAALFVAYALEFFNSTSLLSTSSDLGVDTIIPPTFAGAGGPIESYINTYGIPTLPIDWSDLETEIEVICPDDECAQAWLRKKLAVLAELWNITNIPEDPTDPTGPLHHCLSPEIRLTISETLYSLGILSLGQIALLSDVEFYACIKGTILDGERELIIRDDTGLVTVTCNLGKLIHEQVTAPTPPAATEFVPINPGDVVNCVPPVHLSKLGPNAYLQDLLSFEIGDQAVAQWIKDTRDGLSFDDLLVSTENAELQIPIIDHVNELLEAWVCRLNDGVSAVDFTVIRGRLNQINDLLATPIATLFKDLLAHLDAAVLSNDLIEAVKTLSSAIEGELGNGLKNKMTAVINTVLLVIQEIESGNSPDLQYELSLLPSNEVATALISFLTTVESIPVADLEAQADELVIALNGIASNLAAELIIEIVAGVGVGGSTVVFSSRNTILSGIASDQRQAWLTAIPEHSSVNGPSCAYEPLASSTVACDLPYHQVQEVSAAYLERLGANRFELARKFSEHIHGFAYEPGAAPVGFKHHLYHLPVHHDQALEYLGLSDTAYEMFYADVPALDPSQVGTKPLALYELFGYSSFAELEEIYHLPVFLERTCIDCCEFTSLLRNKLVPVGMVDKNGNPVDFKGCDDCELGRFYINVTGPFPPTPELVAVQLWKLATLIRLWRQLRKVGIHCYSLGELSNLAIDLKWMTGNGVSQPAEIRPHFLEQLVALDMLRTECGICFHLPEDMGGHYLSTLLQGPAAAAWEPVVEYFLDRIIAACNAGKPEHDCRPPAFRKLLAECLPLLAKLAGFHSDTDPRLHWYYQYTNILRFAQILKCVCESPFSLGQLHFIFTADAQLVGDDPFPQQSVNEAIEHPFQLPGGFAESNLADLRSALIAVQLTDEEIQAYSWERIDAELRSTFDYGSSIMDAFLDMGMHFFPGILETVGFTITNLQRQFRTPLASTSELMWLSGEVQPFRYDPTPGQESLVATIPFSAREVLQKLQSIRDLDTSEETAVQNLYYAPRLMLAPFAAMFSNFGEAQRVLIETTNEQERWQYFQGEMAIFFKRCETITHWFTRQWETALGVEGLDPRLTRKMINQLYADDNAAATPWEDTAARPALNWENHLQAGGYAALLGLVGTGLKGSFYDLDDFLVWQEVRGGLSAYGDAENTDDSPVPTVLPGLNFSLATTPTIGIIRNGFVLSNGTPSDVLGGAQGYKVKYEGIIYLTEAGLYTFRAGAPTPQGMIPDFEQAKHSQWRLTISQGKKKWVVLDNDWEEPDTPGDCSVPMRLMEGAYDICFEFCQPQPSLTNREEGCPQPTGWEIKWTTPSEEQWMTIPIEQLYHKESFGDLGKGVNFLFPTAQSFLEEQYHAGIVSIRRTAIRLLGAGLLLHGMDLNAEPVSDTGECEAGYLLNHPELFSGQSYYWDGSAWQIHSAHFDLNLLPVLDNYCPPERLDDQRAEPDLIRIQALFAWFERLCEFRRLKNEASAQGLEHIWRLWQENGEFHEDLPGHLQRFLGIPFDHTTAVTKYFENKTLESADVLTEEWTIRIWETLKCLRKWKCQLGTLDISALEPATWVSTNFSDNGNENLVEAITAALWAGGASDRVQELQAINDHIRKRSRDALVAYLGNSVDISGNTLSEYLLNDVAVACCQQQSRLDMSIGMVQQFLHRVRLGLESVPGVPPDPATPIQFSVTEKLCWEQQFSSFEKWHECAYRDCYPEEFADYQMIAEDRKSPGFAFLEEQLSQHMLSSPVSASTTKLAPEQLTQNGAFTLLQEGVPSTLSSGDIGVVGIPTAAGTPQWESVDHPNQIDFWVETAERLGTSYLRIPAAGLPLAELTHQCEDKDCCPDCEGKPHLPVDEYFVCLIDAKYYPELDRHYLDWEDDNIPLAQLLNVRKKEMVFLAWARVHRGRAGVLQWSADAVKVDGNPELVYNGRYQDSLFFTVTNADTAAMEITDSSGDPVAIDGADLPPGFRLDLAESRAAALPTLGEILPDAAYNEPYYFVYHDPGVPRTPKDLAATSLVIARHLQDHCQYAEARDWLDHTLQPLQEDNRWWMVKEGMALIDNSKEAVRRRTLVMAYLDNLVQWANHLQQMNTTDTLRQAAMIYGVAKKIMGPRPTTAYLQAPTTPATLLDFEAIHPGLNSRLLCMYEDCEHGLSLIHHCLSVEGIECTTTQANWSAKASCNTPSQCCIDDHCIPSSPYNYRFLQAKATEYANILSNLGGALLSALEKGDQESLSLLREIHANQLMERNLIVRETAMQEAHFSVEAIEKQLKMAECRWMYFDTLLSVGLLAREQDYVSLTEQSMVAQAASQALHAASQFIVLFPDIFTVFAKLSGGEKTASSLRGGASVASAIGGILATRAGLKLTKAGWERREQEWKHQRKVIAIEIEQIKNQLVAARLRLINAENDVTNHHLQIDHSRQTLAYLRDKFTSYEFYRWQQRELARLYRHAFDCALQMAQQAQRAYNIENGYSNRQFLNIPLWDNLRKGLLAGERLSMVLQQMDKTYLDGNHRRFERSKSLSFAAMFPRQLLALKYSGKCFLEIPEVVYTKDYPGHYCLMMRSVAVTIPCVVGPYTSVNATIRLHSSTVRTSPALMPPAGPCKTDHPNGIYELQEGDKRFVYVPGNEQAIATSKGINDSGYHEFRFTDDRLLTFENHGAAAKFCIEMPHEDNQFDLHSMSDFILDIHYTAKEGGKLLADAARAHTQNYLPGNGEVLLCMDEVRPDDWYQFQQSAERRLAVHLGRQDFPYIPGHHHLFVDQLEFFIETGPCPECDGMEVYFQEVADSPDVDCDEHLIPCVKWEQMGGLFHGLLPYHFNIQDGRIEVGKLILPADVEIKRIYIIAHYGKDVHSCEPVVQPCGC